MNPGPVLRPTLLLFTFMLPPLPSMAGNTGAPDPALMLGPLPVHPTEPAALAVCGPGNVVWAERHAGYYFTPGEPRYGTAAPGAYACRADADAANYWSTDPMAGVMNYRGKSFRWPDPPGS